MNVDQSLINSSQALRVESLSNDTIVIQETQIDGRLSINKQVLKSDFTGTYNNAV